MPEIYDPCTLCILIRCLHYAPKITIRRKCTQCNRIWIAAWGDTHDPYSQPPGWVATRYGECPFGQKIATEYLGKCPECYEKQYQQRRKGRGWS